MNRAERQSDDSPDTSPGTAQDAPGSLSGSRPGVLTPSSAESSNGVEGTPLTSHCLGCRVTLRTGDVVFGVERHGRYHVRCGAVIPDDATIATIGVFVETRHLTRMPGSARKRVERARLLIPAIVKTLTTAGKIDGVEP